jgi:NADPH:quinone reductase-like Zn-dependent oxidoreductase
MLRLFGRLTRLLRAGVLTTPVAAVFPLTDIQAAVRHAEEPGRAGKVLLRCGEALAGDLGQAPPPSR